MRRRKPVRRGVLLLVILSLLVLFLLAGITFIVVTGQFRRASAHLPRYERTGDPPAQIMDDAILQLLRGTNEDARSVLYGHDLLGDLYGNDYFPNPEIALLQPETVEVAHVDPGDPSSAEFPQFAVATAQVKQLDKNTAAFPGGSGYYNGSIITFRAGEYAGISARIVDFEVGTTSGDRLFPIAVTFELPEGIPVAAIRDGRLNGIDFLINGRQFNGTGAGYDHVLDQIPPDPPNSPNFNIDARTQKIDSDGTVVWAELTALLPNYLPGNPGYSFLSPNGDRIIPPDAGGFDESYDAPDFQNMFLAFVAGSTSAQIIPSFHRPALINYWLAQRAPLANDAGLLRKVMLRPNWLDHPTFTGSNPLLSLNATDAVTYPSTVTPGNPATPADLLQRAIDGVYIHPNPAPNQQTNFNCWDVDNDMDGVADSVWVDLGFPPQQTPDGRLYKPLFAILCVDLDSRINVNVHGSQEHLASYYNQPLNDSAIAGFVAVAPSESIVSQGFGPGDVNLGGVLTDPSMVDFVISSRYTGTQIEDAEPGKYYDFTQLTNDPSARDESLTKWTQTIRIAGADYTYTGSWKLPGLIPDWGVPLPTGGYGPGAYGLPPDYHGAGSIVLNHAGQPLSAGTWDGDPTPVAGPTNPFPTQTDNDPFEINVLAPQAEDRIYQSGEWEAIARTLDYDHPVMASRMRAQSLLGTLETFQRMFTSRSFDISTPNTIITWMQNRNGNLMPPTNSLTEAVRRLLLANGVPTVDLQLKVMLPFEVRRGEKFDLNRLLGQGLDDDGNLVVDDESWVDVNQDGQVTPDEFTEPLAGSVTLTANGQPVNYQLLNDDPLYNAQQRLPQAPLRQAFARHLYCLIMFLKQPGAEIDFDGIDHNQDGAIDQQDNSPAETARGIAQWCVNVIDFRDSDAIMTPFEVDLNPFDGWNVDGDLNTHEPNPGVDNQDNDGDGQIDEFDEWTRWVVWGCERPELLITETLAFHDRRTEDRDDEFESRDHREYAKDENYPRANPSGVPATTQEPPRDEPDERPDQEFDQAYRPLASLYVEFFNPWMGHTKAPLELYGQRQNGMPGVALDATTPNGDPVWRMLVVDNLQPLRARPGEPLRASQALLDPDETYPIPSDPVKAPLGFRELADGSRLPFAPDRSIFFTNVETANPEVLAGFRAHYYRPGGTIAARAIVPPGTYGVAGPPGNYADRQGEVVNPIGLLKGARVDRLREIPTENRKIKLVSDPNLPARYGVEVSGNTKDPNTGAVSIAPNPADGDTQPPVALSVNTTAKVSVDTTTGIPRPINPDSRVFGSPLAVSDPLGRTYDERAVRRGAGSVSGAASTKYARVMDIPLDDPDDRTDPDINYDGGFDVRLTAARNADRLDNDADWKYPLAVRTLGTTVNFKKIHLQRLTNPLVPFHPVTNPYRTIDSAWVDLTVYNGLVELEGRDPDGSGQAAPALDFDGEILDENDVPDVRPGVQNPWDRRPGPFRNSKQILVRFRSRQRGDSDPRLDLDDANNPVPPNHFRQFWRQPGPAPELMTDRGVELSETEASFEGRGNRHNFPFVLSHTLGFANHGKSPPYLRRPDTDARHPIWGEQRIPRNVSVPFAGLPDTSFDTPFPWLVWNNRPFANAMELLQVPYASSFRLLGGEDRELDPQQLMKGAKYRMLPAFGIPEPEPIRDPNNPNRWLRPPILLQFNPYYPQMPASSTDPLKSPFVARSFFGHLLNFFNANSLVSPQLARLFDYVDVPSLYEGVDKWYAAGNGGGFPLEFQPPFNHLSRFRRPGMINLNTISDAKVWDAIMHGNPGARDPRFGLLDRPEGNIAWNRMLASRRGYDSIIDPNDPTADPPVFPPQSPMELNAAYPTRFANPFCAASAAPLMPNVGDLYPMRKSAAVEATLLRPMLLESFDASLDPNDPNDPPPPDPLPPLESLFDVPRVDPITGQLLAFYRQFDHADRNSYFHHYTLQRLGSLATSHSNCFAVWVTVGYFEVQPWRASGGQYDPRGPLTFDEGHPDGWMLGQEIDSDMGQAQRNRAFYIIDRSIPVGYLPGEDLGAWETVVLRRVIE